ncbi:protein-L-isoaspartate O-methyltransferase [Caldichromatium japonicum]|uniref:Protein-L-isoaspartate O-methyltransferase n=1 Tax=Caldichromatium japonicum TaxID=2699430 RepID=A0A6G7VDR8_9GAMM|nr:protein-L-isoaspartate O-methyltransferase [Caldichromatium japonicum]QIK38114.1 protein-L-isoaspartate O-methyltransferase [Caldichromatium japonicum]
METASAIARFNMVHQQLRPWGVLDERVLEVMGALEREQFVPDAYRALAYADIEIPLPNGDRMLAPKLVGHLLQALAIQSGERALEIGTGSGYMAACLRRLGARVVSMEIDPAQAAEARARLEALGLTGIDVREGDGLVGSIFGGPFDTIAVNGSVPDESALSNLKRQLKEDGRLVCILGQGPAMSCMRLTRVNERDYRRESLFETWAPPLIQPVRAKEKAFVF